ncbi:Core-2/I-Branching enzyme [Musa troglodytarum]|uniref:Core-2/I-Branching enzyme n=1 Tax=Musa troglodytarum TaxID=320322 RepID=A0A9E7FM14_9LILI|nr:Core-2/I-Branching enzyme [Musa troglodytarum]
MACPQNWFPVHATSPFINRECSGENLSFSSGSFTTVYPKFDRLRSEMIVQHKHYFPTVLTVKVADIVANRSITWELWRSRHFEPVTFGMKDPAEELQQKINEEHECFHNDKPTAVCFLFAAGLPSTAQMDGREPKDGSNSLPGDLAHPSGKSRVFFLVALVQSRNRSGST